MTIKERYEIILKKDLTKKDLNILENLVTDAKTAGEFKYRYLVTLEIVDLFLSNNDLDDAFDIINKTINNFEISKYPELYVSFLEQMIYVCINKQNYKSAYRFASIKRNYIDQSDLEVVNRWYLEMAYIYAEMNQPEKSLINLKAILLNNPTLELRSLVLSNLAKIYIDQKDVPMAKETISRCLNIISELNDNEGSKYINYLNAKLYVLEENYKMAKKQFAEIFSGLSSLDDNQLGIGNEYLTLLLDIDNINTAKKFIIQFEKSYVESNDKINLKEFYTKKLKTSIILNSSNKNEYILLINQIDALNKIINEENNDLFNEINEDEKYLEASAINNQSLRKIEKTILLSESFLNSNMLRDNLISFFNNLNGIVEFDSSLIVVLNKSSMDSLPEFFKNDNEILTYNYKKTRLYERKLSFNDLSETIVEKLIATNHELIISQDEMKHYKPVIKGKNYDESGFLSLNAIPLTYLNDMFGVLIIASQTESLLENENIMILKIASNLIASNLISLFFKENMNYHSNILNLAIDGLQEGIFYYSPVKEKLLLDDKMQRFLNVHSKYYDLAQYRKLIDPSYKNEYNTMISLINQKQKYEIVYKMNLNNKSYLVKEIGKPYFHNNNEFILYVGTVTILKEHSFETSKIFKDSFLNHSDYLNRISFEKEKLLNIEYKFSLIKLKIINLAELEYQIDLKNYIIEQIYKLLEHYEHNNVYLLDNFDFILISNNTDQRSLEKILKELINTIQQGIKYKNRIINLKPQFIYLRYPKDDNNVDEALNLLSKINNSKEELIIYDYSMAKSYKQSIVVNKLIAEEIIRNKLELLLVKLNNDVLTYEVKPNILGLAYLDNCFDFIEDKTTIKFETLMFETLYNAIKNLKTNYIINLSNKTVGNILNKLILNKDYNSNIIISIRDYSQEILNNIVELKKTGFKVFLNYIVFDKITIKEIININIDGIYLTKSLVGSERKRVLNLVSFMKLPIFTHNDLPDYDNVITRSDEVISLKEINDERN